MSIEYSFVKIEADTFIKEMSHIGKKLSAVTIYLNLSTREGVW